MAYLFDSNIFLRLAEKKSPYRPSVIGAIRTLRSRGERIYYTPQIVSEFWNVCTRPTSARSGLGLSISRTQRKVNLIGKHFTMLYDSPATFFEWLRLVSDLQIKGVQVHDAKIAASMIVHNIPFLVTFNVKDFVRFPMITAVDPKSI